MKNPSKDPGFLNQVPPLGALGLGKLDPVASASQVEGPGKRRVQGFRW